MGCLDNGTAKKRLNPTKFFFTSVRFISEESSSQLRLQTTSKLYVVSQTASIAIFYHQKFRICNYSLLGPSDSSKNELEFP